MTLAVAWKLLAIFATVSLGWVAARAGWVGGRPEAGAGLPAATRTLSDVAFHLFVPALLFRTMARQDLAAVPWAHLTAFFMPALVFVVGVYLGYRRHAGGAMAAALFGEPGLALHVALVSVHGLILLTLMTVFAELDLARADRQATLWMTVRSTVRSAVLHPVMLPVLLGLAWNLTGLPLPPPVDEALRVLGSAVVPVCLVLIGLNLAQYGLRGRVRGALGLSALKLLLLPALVLLVAHLGFGLEGMPLGVVVMLAALPTGSNALIFAQRYDTHQAEATAAIVVSTTAFALTSSLWIAVLALVDRL
ncbi:MAG: AEC family transporter [Betaproteobacteria bacterium]|nr:AEC family transporter [Betaproteobacteria bacterium]